MTSSDTKRFACGFPINGLPTPFKYLLAGEQRECAANEKVFNEVTLIHERNDNEQSLPTQL